MILLGEFVAFLFTYYILLISVSIMMSCFVQAMRNQIAALIIGLLYGSGIVYAVIDLMAKMFGAQEFTIQKYVPLGRLYTMSIHTQNAYIPAVFIAIIYGMVFFAVHVGIKNRQDVI